MHYEYKYQDRIYLEDNETGEETLVWENKERDDEWGHDADEDSEYNKMMEMDSEYNFTDYDNCPLFWHYIYEIKYKVTKKGKTKVDEKIVRCHDLVEEYFNT